MDKVHKSAIPSVTHQRQNAMEYFCTLVSKFEWNKALIIWTRMDRLPCEYDIQTGIHVTRKNGNEKGLKVDSWQTVSPLRIAFSDPILSNRASEH
jgi:hypothetical protein